MRHRLAPADQQPVQLELHHDMVQIADGALGDQAAQGAGLVLIAELLRHHQDAVVGLRRAHHSLRARHRIGDRLFDQDMQAGVQRRQRRRLMQRSGGDVDEAVRLDIRQRLFQTGEAALRRNADRLSRRLQRRRTGIHQRDMFESLALSHGPEPASPETAHACLYHTHRVLFSFLTRSSLVCTTQRFTEAS